MSRTDTSALPDQPEQRRWRHYTKRILTAVIRLSVAVLAGVYLLSGMYVVKPDEQALITRFGRLRPMVVLPGTHYRMPYPVDKVLRLKPNEVKSVVVGAPPDTEEKITGSYYAATEGVELLTGDENIIYIVLNVQYKISDPAKYMFNCMSPDLLVNHASEMALSDTVARTHVDDLLTRGKQVVLSKVKKLVQGKLNYFDAGILITSANFASVSPPYEVVDAFKDVASALEDRDRIIHEARGDCNHTIPKARGEATNMVREARAHKEEKTNRAKGDADRFLAMLNEYRQAGQDKVSLVRLYIETMEDVLPQMKKYIVDTPAIGDVGPESVK